MYFSYVRNLVFALLSCLRTDTCRIFSTFQISFGDFENGIIIYVNVLVRIVSLSRSSISDILLAAMSA